MNVEWTWWAALLAVLNVSSAIGVTIHAVLWKRDSRAVIAWVGLAWLAPLLGVVGYLCFGINRIQRKASSFALREAWQHTLELALNEKELAQQQLFNKTHPNFGGLATLGEYITGHPILPGNHIEPLVNGDEAYPAMLQAIDEAQTSISLMSYIFDDDQAGAAFIQALKGAHGRGLEIRVLVDDVGARYSQENTVDHLQALGLKARSFLPARFPRIPRYMNLRNHRKILVVDGRIGFTGGTNIREDHWYRLAPQFPVRCLHFRLEGPVVAHLQEAFAIDWAFVSGETLLGTTWFPTLTRQGGSWARGIADGPDEDFEKLADLIFAALACARHRVRIMTPYFLPNAGLIQALRVAAMRGLTVEIFLPEENNIPLVDWAARAQLWQVLEKGCRVFFTPPPFDHTKLMIVDTAWALFGSTNWDPRSLRLNFEFNVECYDPQLVQQLHRIVDIKAAQSRQVTLTEVNNRSFPVRLRDGLARLFTPFL